MTIYQHYREEEHPFIDQVLSWKDKVENTFQSKLTDFLDPREQQIVETLIGIKNEEIQLKFSGGGKYAERKRALIAPYYETLEEHEFKLTLFEASFNEKFISLEHRDVMGAFLSLGIDRTKLGDIFVTTGKFQLVVAEEIADYIIFNLNSVKNASIKLTSKPLNSLLEKKLHWIEEEKTVSSLRLDVVIKEIYRLSRKNASLLLDKNSVKVNFKSVDQVAYPLYEGDLISVRGKGRSKLVSINGRTKKDKYRITTALLK